MSMFLFMCNLFQHTGLYPIVSKGMRLIAQGKDPLEGQKHMCGMGNLFHYHSTGFPELDEIMRNPQPLIFIMELLQVSYRVLLDDLKIISPRAGSSSKKKLLNASEPAGGAQQLYNFCHKYLIRAARMNFR